ncbi:ribonuclease HII [Psychroserpens ponticola]|uniref:Ribonuclease HII n=1 Tax=Psychroserpens ponticola TaxID=2932268 RepID=A0ABY7RZB3_9FLAO|nr:ribonuclease HII [Psychroserpens ponticola]WCO01035.1 ribonuclease HII [Psychroserpens ponticola]
MKNIWLLIVFCILTLGCRSDKKTASDIFSYIPENSSIIIKTNSLESLKSAVNNNTLINELLNYPQIQDLNKKLKPITFLKPESECFITLSKDQNDSLEISFITNYKSSVFEIDSIPNLTSETFTSKNKSISKLEINNSIFYTSITDSILFISNRLKLVEASFNQKELDLETQNLLNVLNKNKSVSVLINLKHNTFKPLNFKDSKLNASQISNYLFLEGDISQNDIHLNGITKATDSTKSLINIFKNTIPQENKIARVIPFDSDYFLSFTFSDIKIFEEQLSKFNSADSLTQDLHLFETIIEAGFFEKDNKRAIILQSIDATTTLENLTQNSNSTYRSIAIYNWDNAQLTSKLFSPLIPETTISYYANIEDFFILTEDIDFLETIIANVQNNTTLAETDRFKDMMLNLSDESSLFVYANEKDLNTIMDLNFNADKNLNLKAYKTSAIQYIYDTDFAHVNALFKTNKSRVRNNAIIEDINITIDASLLNEPQLVNNHTNNQKDIAVQDINNNLYLISNQGKIYWKKQLDGKILGKIEQIDMYKNGRLQLAFATSSKLYVLDRNGKDASPFPLQFNDKITQPLSVFDYDKKRNYRLMVTQGKNILMYDQRGKIVSGFTYKAAKNNIKTQPKHFRVSRKDYIVFADGNTMEVLDRVGKRRVRVKENIDYSDNEIFLYKNNFTTSNSSGELLEVNQKGNVTHKNLNLSEKHSITTTSKTLVTLSDNKLTIKTKTINLDFGDYTAPKIFYINDKIYVTVTDLQAKKVYVFDSQAKPINNFPIYGNSSIEMDDIDNDKSIEVIVKGDDNSIIIYEIN